MSQPYEELLEGDSVLRLAPGARHELVCGRLHGLVAASVANFAGTRLLPARSRVQLAHHTFICPDLALVTAATGKLWLAAEVVSSDDHHADTVIKKQLYEAAKLPRLWMLDPRYDNVEVYHAHSYGLILRGILTGPERLTEKLLPEFELGVADLFRAAG
ncbi:MAG: Uma2 family endonuclease [Verrucomicrobia bacterium]|nr:Uma2 family endonuclease [Verrucomicrobiota bacterium]